MKHTITNELDEYVAEMIIASSSGRGTNKQIKVRVFTRTNKVDYVVKDNISDVVCNTLPDAIELYNTLP